MKIAYCLTGYPAFDGRATDNLLLENSDILTTSYDRFKKHILANNEVDIFIHTWYCLYLDKYLNLFKPKKYLVEHQPDFRTDDYDKYFKTKDRQQNIYVRTYAIEKVLQLCIDYGTYDLVVITRPDIFWWNDFNLSSLDSSKFHISDWLRFYDNDGTALNANDLYKIFTVKDFLKYHQHIFMGYPKSFAINDILLAMGYEYVDHFLKFHSRLDEIKQLCLEQLGKERVEPHALLGVYLYELGIMNTNKMVFSFKYARDYLLTRYYVHAQKILIDNKLSEELKWNQPTLLQK